MILATRDDYEYPHIDWVCKHCGTVYVSSGPPDTDFCPGGNHQATFRPNDEQIEEYIDLLESLRPGDGIVVCGDGPAPLMGPIFGTGGDPHTEKEGSLVTYSIDSPVRHVAWNLDEKQIGWKSGDDHAIYRDVYHVETVEIESTNPNWAAPSTEGEA